MTSLPANTNMIVLQAQEETSALWCVEVNEVISGLISPRLCLPAARAVAWGGGGDDSTSLTRQSRREGRKRSAAGLRSRSMQEVSVSVTRAPLQRLNSSYFSLTDFCFILKQTTKLHIEATSCFVSWILKKSVWIVLERFVIFFFVCVFYFCKYFSKIFFKFSCSLCIYFDVFVKILWIIVHISVLYFIYWGSVKTLEHWNSDFKGFCGCFDLLNSLFRIDSVMFRQKTEA